MNKITTAALLFCTINTLFAGNPTSVAVQLAWTPQPAVVFDEFGFNPITVWQFDGAIYNEAHPSLPYFFSRIPVDGPGAVEVSLQDAVYEPFTKENTPDDAALDSEIRFQTAVSKARNDYFGKVSFIPIRQTGPSSFERLVSFTLEIRHLPGLPGVSGDRGDPTTQSILSQGDIYKVSVSSNGMYKMDYDFLKNNLGLENLDDIDPRRLQLYGNGGGMLPELVGQERIDDLQQNRIRIVGESDGSFDPGDYILFYGEGPSEWTLNEETGTFDFQMNVYDFDNYYFLKIGAENGLRVESSPSVNGVYLSTSYNDYLRYEQEKVNLLSEYDLAQGSGRMWFGDYFKNQRSFTYTTLDLPNRIESEPVEIKTRFAARANGQTNIYLKLGNQTVASGSFNTINLNNPNGNFAFLRDLAHTQVVPGALSITIDYPEASGLLSEGWLDFIQVNARCQLRLQGIQMDFRDVQAIGQAGGATYQISNTASGLVVWDITDPLSPVNREGQQAGTVFSFGADEEGLRQYIAFYPDQDLFTPTSAGKVSNQNLHGILETDMVILYHPDLESEAQRLATHRSQHSGLEVTLVPVGQVFNEFSSGKKDASAIRDFARMLYQRSDRFRYLLLFGDGSFDHRNIEEKGNNLVMTFQTTESANPIFAFPSDDYFGLLDDNEGLINTNDELDISIGRIPAANLEEARGVVDKIINYDTNPSTLGDWRNRIVFVGDDEDSSVHTDDADEIAEVVETLYPNLNIDKIYLDAFNQISTPGGKRAPTATEALNNNLFRGVQTVVYLGHGGAKGWAQERILQIPDILSWDNFNALPLFITATCSFSGYDDPGFTTAGELVLFNPEGGAIALYTTVRAVYASTNAALTKAAAIAIYEDHPEAPTIGDLLRVAKSESGGQSNSRKFTLLGDPSQLLAKPELEIALTGITTADGAMQVDTISALQKITVEGEVRDENGQLQTGFNGTLFPTVFDKSATYRTLGQDGTPIRNFDIRKNVLFKGRASVNQGKFKFTFVTPKDINFNYGPGKISFYASDGQFTDAAGHSYDLIIGGADTLAAQDEQGPQVAVFMNSAEFVFGGITGPNPTLLVQLADDLGINVVGNSIGHDLTGVLDENTQNTFLLNAFYEAALDDYTRGEVRYPLSELEDGLHTLRVKAWDVANNSAEGYTEFVVAADGKIALDHVLNYPNPFINSTCFQFEHNMENQDMDVQVDIYTVSGRLVKTIRQRIFSAGSRLSNGDCLQWDGRDDFGDPLAKGVYLYKVRVQVNGAQVLEGESDFEKLVILR